MDNLHYFWILTWEIKKQNILQWKILLLHYWTNCKTFEYKEGKDKAIYRFNVYSFNPWTENLLKKENEIRSEGGPNRTFNRVYYLIMIEQKCNVVAAK